jgi:hypothetical protein
MNQIATNSLKVVARAAASATAAAVLLCQPAWAQTIPNPSFETDTFTVFPGYISDNTAITGWTGTPANRVGLNPASTSPFADNGVIPAGTKVAFIQVNPDDPSAPSTLSTTISGLTAGTTYKGVFRANARGGQTPNVKVYVDTLPVLLPGGPDGFSTASVGGVNPYWHVAFEFTATAATATLAIVNDATGDHTLLVDDFTIAPSSGKWSTAAWTGDAESGIDESFLYTHAYNLGSSANVVINGVSFTGVSGAAPAVAGKFSSTYLGNGPVGDTFVNIADNSATMAGAFVYGGDVPAGLYQSITMEGLTPGTEYIVTIYSVAWEDPAVGSRWAAFSMGNDYFTVNQDQFFNDNGIRISYRYTATSSTATINFAPFVPRNVSIHVYGFSNREAVSRFVAPIINAQPKSIIVSPDLAVDFSVAATGVPAPAYQWRFNGVAITDATDATYTVPSATTANVGAYDVVLTNRGGVVTSAVARLTLGLPIANPSFEVDSFPIFPGYVSGNFPITAWTTLPNHGLNPASGSPFADNGTIPHGIQVAFMQGDGSFSQMVSGFTVGAQYYVHYFENARTETTIPALEVQVGGTTVVPVHSILPVRGGNPYYEISSDVFVATAATMELAFLKSSPQGGDCTALIDNVAIVAVPAGTAPLVGLQPQPMTVYVGQAASFRAVAQGSLPLRYQWRLNGVAVPGATTNALSIASVRLQDEGEYTLVVTNNSGSVTSAVARLSLLETIPSLRNTGIGADGAPIAGGAVDPFWTLPVNPDGGSTEVFVGNDGWPIQAGVWMVNSAASKWVGSRAAVGDGSIPVGEYVYRTTFDLTGRDTNTVLIVGRWASDNAGTAVFVNGKTVSVPVNTSFGGWLGFTITTNNAAFLQGINTIDFGIANGPDAGPSGLRLEFTQTSARTLPGIPAAIALQPQGTTAAEGDTVTLTVTATGTLPISYQWKKDGADLAGKTDSTLTLSGLTTGSSGNYSVVVANTWGTVESAKAAVAVAFRPIPGIYGTGLDAAGQLLPDGVADLHYVLSASADPAFPGPDALVITNAWPIQAGTWLVNGPNSRWIAPSSNQRQDLDPAQGNAPGDYTFQTTFNLTGYDVSKVRIVGGWAIDNTGIDILVNGVSSGNAAVGFGSLTPFVITNGLVAGINTLDFLMNNTPNAADPTTPNPAGLRVDLKGYLTLDIVTPVTVKIIRSGANVAISWSPVAAGQKLMSAPDLTGPWTEVLNASNPYSTVPSAAKVFYRVAQ